MTKQSGLQQHGTTVNLTQGHPKVPLFRTFSEYRYFYRSILFPVSNFTSNKIISNLIDWVLYNRCPIFYWAKNEEERLAYFGCYGVIPIVHMVGPYLGPGNRYKDEVIVGLTHLHEFVHNLFSYPYSLKDQTPAEFDRIMQRNEWAASNFTEVFAYYIIPELFDLTKRAFFRPSWIDALRERGFTEMPKLAQVQSWRRAWIKDPETWEDVFAPGEKYAGTRAYMRRFFAGNEDFNHKRLERLLQVEGFKDPCLPSLSETSYMDTLEGFVALSDEEAQMNYEKRQLTHITLLYKLLNISNPPVTFDEALARIEELYQINFLLE